MHPPPFEFHGRVVLVTGGARGIGRAIVEAFLDAGAEVETCGRMAPAEPVAAGGRTVAFRVCDVRRPEAVQALVRDVAERRGQLDVLVNNAGGSPAVDAATASPRFSEAIVALNLLAPLHAAQAANAIMQAQADGGAIINIASLSGLRPSPGTAAYGAAKAGLLNLTQSLAQEWGPRVRVNAVAPGYTRTDDLDAAYGGPDAARAIEARLPLRRMATPEDVARATLYLASPYAAYVSGACLPVHGGGERPFFLEFADPSRATGRS